MDLVIPIVDREQPEVYIYCSLAWSKSIPLNKLDEFKRNVKSGDITKDPERVEVLVIWGKTMDGKVDRKYIYDVIRDSAGKITDFVLEHNDKMDCVKMP